MIESKTNSDKKSGCGMFWIFLSYVLWLIVTMLLVCSIVGMLLIIPNYNEPSSWMKIGRTLVAKLTSTNSI